jgi:hypothetical protein
MAHIILAYCIMIQIHLLITQVKATPVLQSHYKGSSDSNNRKLGNRLYQMKSQRVKADYNLDLTINQSDLSLIILDTQIALKRLI